MNIKRLTLGVALGLLPGGCQLYLNFARNLYNEPANTASNTRMHHRCKELAKEAWADFKAHYPGQEFSHPYADGFKDGFADFLEKGHTTQPPAEPPYRYRRTRNLTPDGRQRAEEYYAGFAEGSEAARASGMREFLVVPVLIAPPPPNYYTPPPRPPDGHGVPGGMDFWPGGDGPSGEALPQPQPLPGMPASVSVPREEIPPEPLRARMTPAGLVERRPAPARGTGLRLGGNLEY
jgi:hypothetical protein